jgi:hypothetical protein
VSGSYEEALRDPEHRRRLFSAILGDDVVAEHQLVFRDAPGGMERWGDIEVWTRTYNERIGVIPYNELSYRAMRGTTDLRRYLWEKVGAMLADYTEPILIMRRAQVGG